MSGSVPTSLTPVAIVGVAALIPGARDASEFWKLVLTGQDMITDVPPGHWLTEDYYDPDPEAPDKTYGKRGAFLPPVEFDPLAFGVPPNTMPSTDTTQLLSLMVAERVLADIAGADLSGIDRDRVSVILGTAPLELLATMGNRLQRPVWLKALRESGMPESQAQKICDRIADHYVPWQEATFPGLLSNVVAGRIANRFDLHGTNCTTDAACASSLAALSSGMNELALGKADMVITGGVDTLNDVLMYMCFSKTPALSRSGDCRPFSEDADGTVLGEGLIMFALRRLEDAERDGDKIYAVIRGLGSSSDGKSTAIYAPLPAGQERALRRAYESAGYSPDTVELVEAHGTGTTAGDLAEVTALRTVFGDTGRADQQWCALGSIKSQIGHTKSAAGAAGLLKAALALHHKVLPPTIKVDQPNPRLELDGSPFYLNTRARPWIASGEHPRRASVSSFGFGGSNFHVALEEYVPQTNTGNQPGKMLHAAPSELVLVSAESGPDLVTCIDALAGQETSLAALARGSWQDFDAQAPARAAIVATDHDDLVDKADRLARTVEAAPDRPFSSPIGIHYRTGPAEPGKVAFLFSGQGSQYVGMGRDLTVHFPEAQQVWSEASRLPLAERPLHSVVFPPPAFENTERERQQTALNATEWAQPALAAQSLAQLRLLHRLGIEPDCAGGHSFGELVALHSAGSLDAHALVKLARRRGELMRDASERSGAMLAVTAARRDIESLLADGTLPRSLWISAHNSPNQVVVSGETDAVENLERRLADINLPARRLRAATAFHSPLVEAAGSGLLETLEGTHIEAPRYDVYGNTDSTPYPADPDTIRLRLADHLTSPVNFVQEIEAMYAAGVRTFIEVGAGTTVSGLIGQILDGRTHLAVSLDHEHRDGVTSLNDALGRLALQGVAMDLQALWAHSAPGNPLPSKQFGLSMTLTGTNYGKSYPPHGGAAALPAPNPEQPDRPAAEPVAAALVQSSVPSPRIEPVPTEVPQSPAALEGLVPAPLRPDGASASPWLQALQESDRQTAEAHAAYQRAMAESHSAFLALAESSLAGLAAMVQGGNGIPVLPVIAPAAAPQNVPAAAPQQEAAPPRTVPAPVVSQDTQSEQPVPAAIRPDASSVSSAAASATAAAAPEADLRELLISVVAEKTGYPAEMLRPEMELETDLGIDSIKRVQILSALRERVPNLTEISVADIAQLRSLGSIADALIAQNTAQTPAATTPATSTAAPEADLRELLISVVAEKTGYPAEMLRPEMELETDLGIDSIKRVQILSALRERVPNLTEISVADIAQLRSLGSIADALIAQNGSGATSPVPSASDTAAATAPSLTRQVVKAVPAPPSGQRIGGLTSGSVAITDDGTGIAHQVANRFTELGVEAGVVTRIPADAHGVVFLGGLREVSSVDEALAVNREAFEAARDFARGPAACSGWFVTVQDTGGDFGMSGAGHTRAWLGGVAGLARTARLEWPESAVKAIDCERGDRTAEAIADAIVDELLTGGPTNDVGLKADGTRLTLQIEELPVQAQGPAAVDSESVIVATGGARGVTAEVLKTLARAHRPRIALLGRTALGSTPAKLPDTSDTAELTRALMTLKAKAGGPPPTPADLKAQVSAVLAEREIQATIDALHATGAHVRYVAVDVRDTHALDEALGEVRQDWGPITGLIHGAGVLADRLLADKTDEDFTKVFDTKVGGLRALLAATESDPLTLLCLFSSVAARCGNPGQSDYAMANEVLNQVASAYAATRPDCLVRSIGWGPWRGGMVTPALAQHFESNQVPLIPLEAGAAAFVAELADTRDVHVVINAVGADSDTGLGVPPPDLVGEIHVTGTTHPYLADHAVAVTPVLPLAMALEWFTAAARAENPGPRPYELQDVSVLRKVMLDRLAHEGHCLQVRTTSDVGGRRIDLTDTDGTPHFRGRSLPAVNGLQPPAPESPLNLPPADGADLYDGRILFHGPRFRALSALHGVSDEGASATVIGARDLGWPGAGWHIDPAAVDGGLQLAVLWAERALGGASLPMAVGALRVYRPGLLDGPALCEVRARKVGGAEGECDIRIIDSDGVVRAEMSRVNVVLRPTVTTADLTATGE